MVDKEEKPGAGSEQAAPPSPGQAGTASSGGLKKLMTLAGIGVGAVALGVVLALFVLKPMMDGSKEAAPTAHTAKEETVKSESHGGAKHGTPSKTQEAHGSEPSSIYSIKDIVINPAGTGGTRFLSVSFAFELGSPELEAQFLAREAVIRDALITILSSKTVAQLTDVREKEITRYQIRKRVADILQSDDLAGVYYTDFVLQ